MLPVRHVAPATILRSLSSRRLINNIAAGHHRLRLPSSRLPLHHPVQLRHYARFTQDVPLEHVAAESKPKPPRERFNEANRARFLCPVPTCKYATHGFTAKTSLKRHVEALHGKEREYTLGELLKKIDAIPNMRMRRQPASSSETEIDATSEPWTQLDPPQESSPLTSILEAQESNERPKTTRRRRKVVDLEPQPVADTDAAPKPSPQTVPPPEEEAPTTISTLGQLLGALDDEVPSKPRTRRKRVTDTEAPPEVEHSSQASHQLSNTSEEQPPPAAQAKKRAGRPPKSTSKPIGTPPEQTPAKRRGRQPSDKPPQPEITADCVNTMHLQDALLHTCVWGRPEDITYQKARVLKRDMMRHADPKRVNIVSEKLCDDVLEYMKPGLLERHKGCDIIDISPGAGLWSRKLNDLLQPRRHVLVEEDYKLYEPFLKPLVEREGTKVIEPAWVIWKDLFEALGQEGVLPDQRVRMYEPHETPERNDSLLVVINMMSHARRKAKAKKMGTLPGMILYQLISSVKMQGLFQKYGLVRMLIWVDDSEKSQFLPKTVQRRKAAGIQAELVTEWIHEVAGTDGEPSKTYAYRRDNHINMEGMGTVLARMKEGGYKVPEGRESALMKSYLMLEKEGQVRTAGEQSPALATKFNLVQEELDKLKVTKKKEGTWSQRDHQEYLRNRWLTTQTVKHQTALGDWLAKLDELTELKLQVEAAEKENKRGTIARKRFETLQAELEKNWEDLDQPSRLRYLVARDNLRAFKRPAAVGPVLMWDRRQLEPLKVQPEEFYPACEGALLDIQPRALESLLRAKCEEGSRMYDQLDLIIRNMFLQPSAPIGPVAEGLWVGAGEGVLGKMRSIHDPALGGTPLKGLMGELNLRTLSRAQLVEFAEKWQQWPFKPTFSELVGRLGEAEAESAEGVNAVTGAGSILD
ncbi:hypothetical protein QBC41DRAFT_324801 [Cercophora samala]|uniref:Mitochondrial transcription factor 1 n=1 Tax=Cercophora samala TaxID=330535 RepID=A0AA40D9N1_9PEZI|nr:hypothetical protein QBC41DRAFT_324801 [Cercophora samala]